MYAVHAFDDRSTSGSNTSLSVHFILPMASQASLKNLWLHGNAGCLSAREQLKAWALREAWKEHNDGTYGMYAWIAEKLTKAGGGVPTTQSVKDLLTKIDLATQGASVES